MSARDRHEPINDICIVRSRESAKIATQPPIHPPTAINEFFIDLPIPKRLLTIEFFKAQPT